MNIHDLVAPEEIFNNDKNNKWCLTPFILHLFCDPIYSVYSGRIKNELSLPDVATTYGIDEKTLADYLKSGRFEKVR